MLELARWNGKVALVTGASSGIGSAVARRLVDAGLTVVAAARRRDRLDKLQRALGSALHPIAMDLGEEASILAAMAEIRETYGALDVLVNSAGIGYGEPLLTGKTSRWREMLDVNVLGLAVCTREGVQLMQPQPEGHVIHIGSLSGHRVPSGSSVYGATKFAVRSLTESLRLELLAAKRPIRVTAVSPGYVESEFHERYYGDADQAAELYSRMKVLEPKDVADAVAYALATPNHVQVHDLLIRATAQPT